RWCEGFLFEHPTITPMRSIRQDALQAHGRTQALIVELHRTQMRVSEPGAYASNDAGPCAGGSLRAHQRAIRCARLRASLLLLSSFSPPSGRTDTASAPSNSLFEESCTPRILHSGPATSDICPRSA